MFLRGQQSIPESVTAYFKTQSIQKTCCVWGTEKKFRETGNGIWEKGKWQERWQRKRAKNLRESLCELEWEDENGGQKSGKPREADFKEKAWAQNMVYLGKCSTCILLLSVIFYKCQLNQVGWWCSKSSISLMLFSLLINWERGSKI